MLVFVRGRLVLVVWQALQQLQLLIMAEPLLVASLTNLSSATVDQLSALPESVKWLEVRADLVGELEAEWLRTRFRGQLLYALRSQCQGGASSESIERRHQLLKKAARTYDFVEIQANTDLIPSVLDEIPNNKQLLSWYGAGETTSELEDGFARLSSVSAQLYKLVTSPATIPAELNSLCFLKKLGRSDTVVYSEGPLGFWSRIVGLQLGSPAVFGLVHEDAGNSDQPGIKKLIEDYGLPTARPAQELFAIIGDPIFHSLSPRLHNYAYRENDYPALFVPMRVESFEKFWREVVLSQRLDLIGLPLNGLTVASPHKEAARSIATNATATSMLADASNILVRNNGWWNADTTDPDIVYFAGRERRVNLRHKRAAVIGCGGAGRAIAAALMKSGAHVTLINRGRARGDYAAKLLGLSYIPLAKFSAENYDIVVNATPVGRDEPVAPFALENLNDEAIIIDLVYGAKPTPLVQHSRAREQLVIDGRDVLLTQVRRQFEMMTGNKMSIAHGLVASQKVASHGLR
jgi:3-dehydroquinate dehydratase/shikimate dehydrogenase